MRALELIVVAAITFAGCTGTGSDEESSSEQGAWTADTTPITSVGTQAGDSTTELHEISAIALLHDGSLAIADASGTVRIFDAVGTLTRLYGRAGDGPGEFRRIVRIDEVHPDTLLVYDQGLIRLSTISREEGRVSPIALSIPFPLQLVGYGSRTKLVLGPAAREWKATSPTTEAGVLHFLVTGAEDGKPLWVGDVEGPSHFVVTFPNGGRGQALIPFSPSVSAAVRDTILYLNRGDSDSILRYRLDGPALEPLVLPGEFRQVTSADWDGYVEASLASAQDDDQKIQMRQQFAAMRRPDRHPTILKLLVSGEGDLWVQRGTASGGTTRWNVLGQKDSVIAIATLPQGIDVMAVIQNRIAGIATDADGVQSVHVFQLRKPKS